MVYPTRRWPPCSSRSGAAATPNETEGLGLGLPIARRLAGAVGGDLGGGGRDGPTAFVFEVHLPLAPATPAAARRRVAPRILLVEDVDLSRRVLAKLLTAEGCQVHEAGDGAEALEVWSAHPVDLVITDQRMPGIAGSALCRRLRDEGFAGPIAIAAGADDPQLRTEIADLADVAILRKPVDRAMLRKWLDSGSSAA